MWKLISEEQPPTNKIIRTKVHDDNGERCVQYLKFKDNLWWLPDMSLYVYYTPTHWYCHVV